MDMKLWKKIKAFFRRRHIDYCPVCDKDVEWTWRKHWIYHPEEPPLFVEWICQNCGVTTGIQPSCLTEEAVRGLGFNDFNDFVEKNDLNKVEYDIEDEDEQEFE